MKWILLLALICWLDAPTWMVTLWGISLVFDGFVWLVRGC